MILNEGKVRAYSARTMKLFREYILSISLLQNHENRAIGLNENVLDMI